MSYVKGHYQKDGTYVSVHYRTPTYRGGGGSGSWGTKKLAPETPGEWLILIIAAVIFIAVKACK